MLCNKCGKNEAVYHNSLVVNGIVVDEHLCTSCNGTKSKSNYFNPIITGHCCKTCGCTFEEFSASGLLGCTDCYNSFREELSSIINFLNFNISFKLILPHLSNFTKSSSRHNTSCSAV